MAREIGERRRGSNGGGGNGDNDNDGGRSVGGGASSEVRDGRLFNKWAQLEVKEGQYAKARHILRQGIELFPLDHSVGGQ